MRRVLVLACLGAAISLLVAGCPPPPAPRQPPTPGQSPAPKQAAIDVGCGDFGVGTRPARVARDDVKLAVGETLLLRLCSNATTGFKWEEPRLGDGSVMEKIDYRFESPTSSAVGASGYEVWTFRAVKKGAGTIDMAYSQPWTGGMKAEWTFQAVVQVD